MLCIHFLKVWHIEQGQKAEQSWKSTTGLDHKRPIFADKSCEKLGETTLVDK
jgi:hypothetical protein